ncbi:MAG: D-alanine--D-alanine ligase, partial [Bacteroidetes bacterium SW_10_40_5]
SVESGRNVFEKLASSQKYEPIPVFLTGNPKDWEFYQIPINLLLKDNADDIRNKIENFRITGILDQIIQEGANITAKYTSPDYDFYPRKITLEKLAQKVDFAFLGLHGRPGEDGSLIRELQKLNLPYNGPDPDCMELTIDKYQTNQFLKQQGFLVADHSFISQEQFKKENTSVVQKIENQIGYPLVAKPSDDGCSSAVKKIDNSKQLAEYMEVIFRSFPQLPDLSQYVLSMSATEEFPPKDYFMVEQLVEKGNAERFLEITGGLLTHYDDQNNLHYEIFEPSEALAEQGILSLEEKFLAGEGQNITPARFADDHETNKLISDKVKQVLKDIAIATGISGYSRIDAFVRVYDNHEVDVVVIEINTLPGLTPATAIFHQAALNNYRPVDFLNKIITFGSQKK